MNPETLPKMSEEEIGKMFNDMVSNAARIDSLRTRLEAAERELATLRASLGYAISKYPEIAKGIADSVNKRRMDLAFEKIGQTMPHDSPLD